MRTFLAILLALAFVAPAYAENPRPTAPGHPKAQKYTKRTVADSTVTDLCDLSKARECVIYNQTDQPLMIKYEANSTTCGNTPITTASDTDVFYIPSGGTFSGVLGENHTICGKLTAVLGSGNVYTAEAS